MEKITFKGTEYNIPGTFGELPAKKAMELYEYVNKISSGEITISEYNFKFVSLVLGVDQQELEDNTSFNDFTKVLNDINKIMISKNNPEVKDEVETPKSE